MAECRIQQNVGFRGFRPGPVAIVGGAAVCLGLIWGLVFPPADLVQAAVWWIVVATIVVTSVVGFLVLPDLTRRSEPARSAAMSVVIRFSPALIAGAAVSLLVITRHMSALPYLPCAWFLFFALALAALDPAVPIPVVPVTALYAVAAFLSYTMAPTRPEVFSLVVGTGFGVGHLVAASMLHLAQRRTDKGFKTP